MPRLLRFALLSAMLALPALVAARADEPFFKDGDRVVMMGDSITEQHLYSNYVETWVVTRYPDKELTFRNVGIGGDRSVGGNGRFKRDVVAYKPTAMTVDFGMNDGGYKPFDEATFKTYMGGLQGIASQAKSAGIRVAWVTPQPLDNGVQGQTARTDYNLTLEQYSEGVKQVAEKSGGLFVDQFHPYLAVLDKARAAQKPYQRITAGDAVHPGPPGQALMAYGILKGLAFPALVSSVEVVLESQGDPRVKAEHCQVNEVSREGNTLRFQRVDGALPYFPEEARAILKWAPILDELNQYTLKVVGLKPGKYSVRLGGKPVAEFGDAELAGGVNLADAALGGGPVAEQVKAVKAAVEAKNKYHHDQIFRGVVLSQASLPDWLGIKMSAADIEARRKAAIEERTAKMPELDAAIRQALKVRPHTVEVVPVGD